MNSSAKLSLSFLGAMALGGVAFACTVSSGTVDDTDGGVNTNTSSSSSSGTATTSSSSSSGGAEACPSLDAGAVTIDSVDCDTCLRGSCCTETTDVYNVDGGTAAIDEYVTDLQHCDTDPGQQGTDACKQLTYQSANDDGLGSAYDRYLGCRLTNCQTQCAVTPLPDAGSN